MRLNCSESYRLIGTSGALTKSPRKKGVDIAGYWGCLGIIEGLSIERTRNLPCDSDIVAMHGVDEGFIAFASLT